MLKLIRRWRIHKLEKLGFNTHRWYEEKQAACDAKDYLIRSRRATEGVVVKSVFSGWFIMYK